MKEVMNLTDFENAVSELNSRLLKMGYELTDWKSYGVQFSDDQGDSKLSSWEGFGYHITSNLRDVLMKLEFETEIEKSKF